MTRISNLHIIQSFDAYLIDCDTFFIVNIPDDLNLILSDDELELMKSLAYDFIVQEFIFS